MKLLDTLRSEALTHRRTAHPLKYNSEAFLNWIMPRLRRDVIEGVTPHVATLLMAEIAAEAIERGVSLTSRVAPRGFRAIERCPKCQLCDTRMMEGVFSTDQSGHCFLDCEFSCWECGARYRKIFTGDPKGLERIFEHLLDVRPLSLPMAGAQS